MMVDVTRTFEDAARNAATWTHSRVREVVQAVVNDCPRARVDWEPGDEEWARILEPEADRIIAYVCAKLPLGFIRGEGVPGALSHWFVWISVSSTETAELSINPKVLDRVFGRFLSRNINYDAVSADEIWWATIS